LYLNVSGPEDEDVPLILEKGFILEKGYLGNIEVYRPHFFSPIFPLYFYKMVRLFPSSIQFAFLIFACNQTKRGVQLTKSQLQIFGRIIARDLCRLMLEIKGDVDGFERIKMVLLGLSG